MLDCTHIIITDILLYISFTYILEMRNGLRVILHPPDHIAGSSRTQIYTQVSL